METIPGYAYVVTAAEDVTVTDSNGLVLEVHAGEQRTFVASTGAVSASGECTIVQGRGNFSLPPSGAGGGYPAAPVPEPLTPTTAMRNGGVYTVAAAGTALNFSDITLPDNATAEVWVECTAATNITWPTAWLWLEGSAPQVACDTATEASHRYRIVVLNEGPALNIVARVAYDYKNALPTE